MNSQGMTLIELIIIIVIAGILAAIAVPKYQDMQSEAKANAMHGSLASIREAIGIWHAAAKAKDDAGDWPTLDSLVIPGVVLTGPFPSNPLQGSENAPDSVVLGVTRGETVGDRGGWVYNPATGEFWPNTNSTVPGPGCTGPRNLNESQW